MNLNEVRTRGSIQNFDSCPPSLCPRRMCDAFDSRPPSSCPRRMCDAFGSRPPSSCIVDSGSQLVEPLEVAFSLEVKARPQQ
jgi:hypothetical protein